MNVHPASGRKMSPRGPGQGRLTVPTLRVERRLLRDGATALACCDEVGRGALSGPVTVGVVVVTADIAPAPLGVRDSKLLTAGSREALVPLIRGWAADCGVGHAQPGEIDEYGIIAALRMAALRAFDSLELKPDAVLLDGQHDYLSGPVPASGDGASGNGLLDGDQPSLWKECIVPPVTTRIKADLHCAAVAAASVLAKTTRDALMREIAQQHPEYGWSQNKGYASAEHVDALRRLGPTHHHRRSWRLPGVTPAPGPANP